MHGIESHQAVVCMEAAQQCNGAGCLVADIITNMHGIKSIVHRVCLHGSCATNGAGCLIAGIVTNMHGIGIHQSAVCMQAAQLTRRRSIERFELQGGVQERQVLQTHEVTNNCRTAHRRLKPVRRFTTTLTPGTGRTAACNGNGTVRLTPELLSKTQQLLENKLTVRIVLCRRVAKTTAVLKIIYFRWSSRVSIGY